MNRKDMYAAAFNLPTLGERCAALQKIHSMKRYRLLDAWTSVRMWFARKIAPANYFDE